MKNMEWFHSLKSPFLAPPDWIFMPVWLILYFMIAVSFFLFIKGGMTKGKKIALVFFFIQLLLNFSWAGVFFGMQNILLALIILALIWFFTLLTLISFAIHSRIAALLLVPYFIWLSFAFYLNFGYFVLN